MAKVKKRMSYESKKAWSGFLFISPWLIGFLFLFIRPLFQSMVFSFSKIKIEATGVNLQYVGLKNYTYAFISDPDFIRQLTDSINGMLYQLPIIITYSLFIAYILNHEFVGRTFVRAVFFLPVIVASGLVINILNGDTLAQMMLSGEKASSMFQTTALQDILYQSGMTSEYVKIVTGLIDNIFGLSWKSGIQILLFLAGLQSVPGSLYEAAKIEGATAWESFWRITFPMISPILMLNIIYTVIDNFTDYSNKVMITIISAARQMKLEYSAAISWIYCIVVFAIIGILYVIINRKVFYMVE